MIAAVSEKPSGAGHLVDGHPVMVDVSDKSVTRRTAVAEAFLEFEAAGGTELVVAERIQAATHKGDAVKVAELAGIMAAKRTSELIPLCHPLPLSHVSVRSSVESARVRFEATCTTTAQTGVEMEALFAAGTAALTLYDMLKSGGHSMQVTGIKLLSKEGGRSGSWQRTPGQ